MPRRNSGRGSTASEAFQGVEFERPPDLLAELLSRSASSDESAFAALYDATSARVFGLVVRVVRNHAIAEEVTQETYLQVWRTALRHDKNRGSAMSWIMTLAHRRAVDRVRCSEAARRRDTAHHRSNGAIDFDSSVSTALGSVEGERVRAALTSLTPVQRQAIELAYFDGCTHTEVAEIVGIPIGTAKTRIRDGLIRLRGSIVDRGAA